MIDSELLLQGYRLGVFPMAMEDDSIAWFSPDPRAIIPLDDFHVPHALRRVARKNIFEIKIDNRFGEVIRACARRKDTWINREIIKSYERLHELGCAHSVEAWNKNKLVGGLYGVARAQIPVARHAMGHAASGAIRRNRHFTRLLFEIVAAGSGIASQILSTFERSLL